jgi:osmoprotectant transport system ATP-binding protein
VLCLQDVSRSFQGRAALGGVSLEFVPRQVTAVVGASGCGKSTLLKLCNGLLRPDAGCVNAFGAPLDYDALPQLRRRMGYAVQGSALFPHLTARENIGLVASLQGWSADTINRRIEELLELMHLETALLRQYPHQLSGGQQQRVALSRAMMLRPEVLLLDEPFAAIDPITRDDIHRQLEELLAAEPATVVLVTHDMREAMRLAQHVVVMHEGRVCATRSVAGLRAAAPEREAEQLLQDLLQESRP